MAACGTPLAAPDPARAPEPLAAAQEEGRTSEPESVEPDSDPQANLPKVALTKDLLFRLMKAELEAKAGQWQGPYVTMMSAAQQTRDPRLAQRAAEIALAAKRNDEAQAALGLWRELAPDSDDAFQYYVGLAVLSDRIDEVENLFRRRLQEAAPATRGMVLFQVQQFLGRARNREQAGKAIERLLAPYLDTAEARVVLAQNAAARNAAAEAQEHARRALAIKPDSEVALLTLAQVLTDQEEIQGLLAGFIARNPHAREARTAYARVLVGQNSYPEARRQFETLLANDPDDLNTLYALGVVTMQGGDAAGAEKHFRRFLEVLEQDPEDERDPGKVLVVLAQLAEQRGELAEAERLLDRVGQDDRDTWFGAQLKRGQLMAKGGDVAGAQRFLEELKPVEPSAQAQLLMVRAQVLRDAGRVTDAYALMQDGARRFSSNPELLYDYALMAEKQGDLEVMESTLRAVIAQAPDNHHAYNALGYSFADRNVRLDEARTLIAKALEMAPNDPFIMDSMGWVEYRLGNLDAAEKHLRRAYEIRNDVEIAVHLGEVLWKKGMKSDAQKLLRQARAKDPKNDTLKSTLTRLQVKL
jgi:tetratricopeptide (TPR) repeat protein